MNIVLLQTFYASIFSSSISIICKESRSSSTMWREFSSSSPSDDLSSTILTEALSLFFFKIWFRFLKLFYILCKYQILFLEQFHNFQSAQWFWTFLKFVNHSFSFFLLFSSSTISTSQVYEHKHHLTSLHFLPYVAHFLFQPNQALHFALLLLSKLQILQG